MPHVERRSHRTTGVTRRGLNPQPLERTFTKDSPIGHAVQCNSSGEAEVLRSRFAMQGSNETEYYFFGHFLDRAREIHIALSEQSFRFSGGTTKQIIKLTVRHGKPGAIIEV